MDIWSSFFEEKKLAIASGHYICKKYLFQKIDLWPWPWNSKKKSRWLEWISKLLISEKFTSSGFVEKTTKSLIELFLYKKNKSNQVWLNWLNFLSERRRRTKKKNMSYRAISQKMPNFQRPYFYHFWTDFQKLTLYHVLHVLLFHIKP